MHYGERTGDKLKLRRFRQKAAYLWRQYTAPYAARRTSLHDKTFHAWGTEYPYFIHRCNLTWRNERCIEVPLALAFLRSTQGECLEFGNVLNHYGATTERAVVDKYELADGVLNLDIFDYQPSVLLGRIVSISTVEHVGWDEPSHDPAGAVAAVDHLRAMLAPTGLLFLSAPLGHNPALDDAIVGGHWPIHRQAQFIKSADNTWHQSPTIEPVPWRPNTPWPPAIWVAELKPFVD